MLNCILCAALVPIAQNDSEYELNSELKFSAPQYKTLSNTVEQCQYHMGRLSVRFNTFQKTAETYKKIAEQKIILLFMVTFRLSSRQLDIVSNCLLELLTWYSVVFL